MQNKRGISQAFCPAAPPQLEIRPATVFDVFTVSEILIASIRELCHADHGGDAGRIAGWTSGKSPAGVRSWISGPGCCWLAGQGGKAAGVCGVDAEGAISLLYVSPEATGQGVGSAMLAHLEAELAKAGRGEGRLNATRTALGFYQAHGWLQDTAPAECCGAPCIPMRKRLG